MTRRRARSERQAAAELQYSQWLELAEELELCARLQSQLEEAIPHFAAADEGERLLIIVDWNSPDVLYRWAHDLHYKLRETEAATAVYQYLIGRFPDDVEARYAQTQLSNIGQP